VHSSENDGGEGEPGEGEETTVNGWPLALSARNPRDGWRRCEQTEKGIYDTNWPPPPLS